VTHHHRKTISRVARNDIEGERGLMSIRKRSVAMIAFCCVFAAWLVWACVPALASRGFAFSASLSATFGSEGAFVVPVGLAIDNSADASRGDVYVSDQGRDVLEKFSSSGGLLGSVEESGATLGQLTVDDYAGPDQGDVFVAGMSSGVVYRFNSSLVLQEELKGLDEPVAVAVDEAGDVFVAEYAGNAGSSKVLEFNTAGEAINASGAPSPGNSIVIGEGLNAPQELAASADGESLYIATGSGTLRYTVSGDSYALAQTVSPEYSTGVALDGVGDVFVDNGGQVSEYDPLSGEDPVDVFGGGTLSGSYGVGVSEASGEVFVANVGGSTVNVFDAGEKPIAPSTGKAASVSGGTATLAGTLNTGDSEYYFEYNSGGSCAGGEQSPPETGPVGSVSLPVTGLAPHTLYTFCLVAANAYGDTPGTGVQFETLSVKPLVEEESFTEAGDRSAGVTARVNVENSESTYYYEYGTASELTAGRSMETPVASIAVNGGPVAAPALLTGLEPNTEYEFHIVLTNVEGEVAEGTNTVVNTLPAGIHGLPDGRVDEMVTPPSNEDADVYVPEAVNFENLGEGITTEFPFYVASNGEAVAYQADPTSNDDAHEGGHGLGDQYLARHLSGGGWSQVSIQPRSRQATIYQGFSSDLSAGVLVSGNSGGNESEAPALPGGAVAPGDGVRVLYKRVLGEENYQPLFTMTPPNRSGYAAEVPNYGSAPGPVYAGGSKDLSVTFFEGDDALIEGQGIIERELQEDVKREIKEGVEHNYLYGSENSRLSLVNILPDGKVAPDATFGGPALGRTRYNPPDFSNVVSGDGQHAFWTDLVSHLLYVRENPMSITARTVQISTGQAQFWTATPNGEYVFYTEGAIGAQKLMRFNFEKLEVSIKSGDTEGQALLEAREELTGENSNMQGVVDVSDDGKYVYFIADGVLADGATEGQPNIYLIQNGAPTRFVTTLSLEDIGLVSPFQYLTEGGPGFEEVGDLQPSLGHRTAEVTPNGSGLVFMHGSGVYVYEANVNKVFCVSCNSNGGTNAFLPISWSFTFMPTWISENGNRVFFDSGIPLVGTATDGKQNVYEWEREGEGSCRESVGSSGGCIYLLSGGTSGTASWLIGSDASGDNVFIVTRAQLTPEDGNHSYNLFDARVGGVEPVAPPACTGTGCQGVPSPPPTFATPPSVTFDGVGNFPPPSPVSAVKTKTKPLTRAEKLTKALKACAKDKQSRKRAVCKADARKRYGAANKVKKTSTSAKRSK
jgi:hypothetical protein